jgi:hypothetical protein
MTDDRMADDLRAAVEERLAASREATRQRREARARRLAELHQRRTAGLRKRHARILARRANEGQDDDENRNT